VHDWAPTHTGKGQSVTTSIALSADYHVYSLEWAHDHTLRFYLNGQLMHTRSRDSIVSANSFIPLEVLFSTLVTTFAGSPGAGLDGTRMSIDYVRIYDTPGFTATVSNNWGSETNWASGRYPRAGDAAIFNRPDLPSTITVAGADKAAREIYSTTPGFQP
jgi:beta-glucanase (GH16 family)